MWKNKIKFLKENIDTHIKAYSKERFLNLQKLQIKTNFTVSKLRSFVHPKCYEEGAGRWGKAIMQEKKISAHLQQQKVTINNVSFKTPNKSKRKAETVQIKDIDI